MNTPYTTITPKLAIKYLRGKGSAFVTCRITKDDSAEIEVKKSSLIETIRNFDDGVKIGYSAIVTDEDVYMFFDWID